MAARSGCVMSMPVSMTHTLTVLEPVVISHALGAPIWIMAAAIVDQLASLGVVVAACTW